MLNEQALIEFAEPYYADKDIMHNMWHIELVKKMVSRILAGSSYSVDEECLLLATYFHGFILAILPQGGVTSLLFIIQSTGILLAIASLGNGAYPSVRMIMLDGGSSCFQRLFT